MKIILVEVKDLMEAYSQYGGNFILDVSKEGLSIFVNKPIILKDRHDVIDYYNEKVFNKFKYKKTIGIIKDCYYNSEEDIIYGEVEFFDSMCKQFNFKYENIVEIDNWEIKIKADKNGNFYLEDFLCGEIID